MKKPPPQVEDDCPQPTKLEQIMTISKRKFLKSSGALAGLLAAPTLLRAQARVLR